MDKIKIRDFENKIEILREAMEKIRKGQFDYICHAIRNYTYSVARESLVTYIQKELQGEYVLENWLDAYGDASFTGASRNSEILRGYRIQWLYWMIKQYKDQIIELKNVGEK